MEAEPPLDGQSGRGGVGWELPAALPDSPLPPNVFCGVFDFALVTSILRQLAGAL